ncbi:MAG: prepilin-type N-terminal cleavage/methylation domain-containing protein [Betaproteobacteria bacterium]|nr:prepilin-type N-terminal cleavage/methylation domain-containing protein [Betaproteobacteria bacterium]
MKQVTSPAGSGREHFTRRGRGFTTIELLIAIVILGILLAVALPSYQSSMRKSRRAEAFTALTSIQQGQERHRSIHPTFTTNLTAAPSPRRRGSACLRPVRRTVITTSPSGRPTPPPMSPRQPRWPAPRRRPTATVPSSPCACRAATSATGPARASTGPPPTPTRNAAGRADGPPERPTHRPADETCYATPCAQSSAPSRSSN